MPLQQRAFWKHSDKRRNCTKHAISPFATMFSTFRLSIQLWRFSMFWQNTFKVVCCRIVVWGKGLIKSNLYLFPGTLSYMQMHFSFCQNVFNWIIVIILQFIVLSDMFSTYLLQISLMCERVKICPDTTNLHQTTLKTYWQKHRKSP